jgi:hypothetical protein
MRKREREESRGPGYLGGQGATKRWWASEQERETSLSGISEGRITDVESLERTKKRLDRLTEAALRPTTELDNSFRDRCS